MGGSASSRNVQLDRQLGGGVVEGDDDHPVSSVPCIPQMVYVLWEIFVGGP